MSVASWARRERLWAQVTAFAARKLKYSMEQRRLAQRAEYVRARALDRRIHGWSLTPATDDDEDEFFG